MIYVVVMSKRSRKNRNKRRNHYTHKKHEQEVQDQETKTSYSELATSVIKTGAIGTLHTVSYFAGMGIKVTDELTASVPSYLKIPSISTDVISVVTALVPVEVVSVISTATPLLTLGDNIRSIDPTGAVDLYITYKKAKTFLSCTKVAADFASAAIEEGSVTKVIKGGVQVAADKYVPSHIKNMVGWMFGGY